MRVLSFIEDPPVVRKILDHLGLGDLQQRSPPASVEPIEFIGDVWPWVAEDPYPYDQTDGDTHDPA